MTDTARRRADRQVDEDALRLLSTAYASAVDDLDGDRLADLFVSDGELVVPDLTGDLRPTITRAGHEALRRVPGGLRRYARTFHQVSDHRFALDGDVATGAVRCVAHHVTAPDGADDAAGGGGSGTDVVWFIGYVDEYRRTPSGWRFARRELHLQWVEEHPVALQGPVPDGRGRR